MGEENGAHLLNGILLRCLKSEIVKFAGKRIELGDKGKGVLCEVTQTQKDRCGVHSPLCGCQL